MKKYPNINKYFNRTPRGYLIFLMILHILAGGGILFWLFTMPEISWVIKIIYLAYVILVALVICRFYLNIVTLVNARLGKHLTKYHGLEGEALVSQIDAIEDEIEKPVYADVSSKCKYNAFFITDNWLVGTDGVNLLRVNACKREDIVNIDTGVMVKIRKGKSYFYHILKVTDKNDYTYQFWLRSQKNLDLAYEKLMKLQEVV